MLFLTPVPGEASLPFRSACWGCCTSVTVGGGRSCMAALCLCCSPASDTSWRHGSFRAPSATIRRRRLPAGCVSARFLKRRSAASSVPSVCWASMRTVPFVPSPVRLSTFSISPRTPLRHVCAGATSCWCTPVFPLRATTAIPMSSTMPVSCAAEAGAGLPTCLPGIGGWWGTIRCARSVRWRWTIGRRSFPSIVVWASEAMS